MIRGTQARPRPPRVHSRVFDLDDYLPDLALPDPLGLGRRGVYAFLGDVRALYADDEGRWALQQVDETLDRITHGLAAQARRIAWDREPSAALLAHGRAYTTVTQAAAAIAKTHVVPAGTAPALYRLWLICRGFLRGAEAEGLILPTVAAWVKHTGPLALEVIGDRLLRRPYGARWCEEFDRRREGCAEPHGELSFVNVLLAFQELPPASQPADLDTLASQLIELDAVGPRYPIRPDADLVALLGECMSLDDRVEQALARGRDGQRQAEAFHGVKRRAGAPRAVPLEQAISEIDEDAADVGSRSLPADDLVRLAWASSDLARAAKAFQWLARHIAGRTPRQRRNLDWGADPRDLETVAHGRDLSRCATVSEARRSASARLQVDLGHEELPPACQPAGSPKAGECPDFAPSSCPARAQRP